MDLQCQAMVLRATASQGGRRGQTLWTPGHPVKQPLNPPKTVSDCTKERQVCTCSARRWC
jgi:hypothetical protein